MTIELETLIESLRAELKEYGELLALLDQQQEFIALRAADDILKTVGLIHQQGAKIHDARAHREVCRRELATQLGLPDGATFGRINARLPQDYRGLVQALVDENNQLLQRVQKRAGQNHLLLSRSLELMQRFLATLVPDSGCTTYTEKGDLAGPRLARRLCDAAG